MPKWRSRSDQPGKGKHYQVDEREPTRLPPRAGMELSDRVAGVTERSLSETSYWCPGCGHSFSGADGKTRCPHCQSLNLERSLGNNRWIKADADEKGAAHLIHTRDEVKKEQAEHPWASKETAEKIAEDHAAQKDKEWGKNLGHDMRTVANEEYVQGKISEKTWRRKMREADRNSAPKTEEVLATMERRTVEQGKPADENQRYNGWSNHDTWETKLILDNTQSTERWQHDWGKNWLRNIKAGRFDPEKAEYVVDKYLVPTARGKNKRFAGPDLTPDPEIDPKKVNKAEIVHSIIAEEAEEEKYRASHNEE